MPTNDPTALAVTISEDGFAGSDGKSTFTGAPGQSIAFTNKLNYAVPVRFKTGVLTSAPPASEDEYTSFNIAAGATDSSWIISLRALDPSSHSLLTEVRSAEGTPKSGTLNVGSGGKPDT